MSRSDLERLRDACDFARHARNNAGGLSGDMLAAAIQPQHAAADVIENRPQRLIGELDALIELIGRADS